MLCGYLHDSCYLCGESIIYQPKTDESGVLYNTPLLCGYCHERMVGQVPTLIIRHELGKIPLYVGAHYDSVMKQVISGYKDDEDITKLMVLYHLMRHMPRPDILSRTDNVALVPTPTTDGRLAERGFNPVRILARAMSYFWQVPIWWGVARHDNSIHQRGLDRSQRLANVKGDFYLTEDPPVSALILLDDVVTTGSTISAIADTLWMHEPRLHLSAVGILHGRADFHLPTFDK